MPTDLARDARNPWPWLVTAGLVVAAGLVLVAMGRSPICPCGTVKLWHGIPSGPESSQHLTDWYSPSHVLHGLVFYLALRYLAPRLSLGWRLAAATAVEVAWEIVENTDWIIQRYRDATISLDYQGDSVINSLVDIAMMFVGFLIAARAPVWVSVALFVAAEVIVAYFIRDGLILNIVMLLWPLEAIRAWQAGG